MGQTCDVFNSWWGDDDLQTGCPCYACQSYNNGANCKIFFYHQIGKENAL